MLTEDTTTCREPGASGCVISCSLSRREGRFSMLPEELLWQRQEPHFTVPILNPKSLRVGAREATDGHGEFPCVLEGRQETEALPARNREGWQVRGCLALEMYWVQFSWAQLAAALVLHHSGHRGSRSFQAGESLLCLLTDNVNSAGTGCTKW